MRWVVCTLLVTGVSCFHPAGRLRLLQRHVPHFRNVEFPKTEKVQLSRHETFLRLSNDNGPSQKSGNRLTATLRRLASTVTSYPKKFSERFQKAPRIAQTILVIQFGLFCITFGLLIRSLNLQYSTLLEIPYSQFMNLVEESSSQSTPVALENLQIGRDKIYFRLSNSNAKNVLAYTHKVAASPELVHHLRSNQMSFSALPIPVNIPSLLLRGGLLGMYVMVLLRIRKTLNGRYSTGDIPGRIASTSISESTISFDDIQGIDDAKLEVMELVDVLKNSRKYAILGARAPTGLLLEGPPGTGKTMLARATAASAGVPLLYCSGSDFVEMYVGTGAARVRKLFERAKKMTPCIIFVDEIDALGKARGTGAALLHHGSDEAEQTLNQLLSCMDGLDSDKQICVFAATNRREVLDPALVRPGRFDRIVSLQLPDVQGRENILRVHARKLPGFQECRGVDISRPNALGIGGHVDLSAVAAVTSGFSGAELEFLVNEAAIRAVRRVSTALREGEEHVTPHVNAHDFEDSLASFHETRTPQGRVNSMWKNVWGQ